MYFARPEILGLLGTLPLLAWAMARGSGRRRRDWALLGLGGYPPRDGGRLWLASLACLIGALAQPRWGRESQTPLPEGHDVVLALDVSRSMGARDAVPDRLGVSVETAQSLLDSFRTDGGDRFAVVAFAGRGVLRCPLTTNLGAVSESLRALKPGDVRPGGTDLAAALDAAQEAFDDQDHTGGRIVILFSDGEDHSQRWELAAQRQKAQGVMVHTVAVGDLEHGSPVPSRPGARADPLRYGGSVVLSQRNDEALRAIAERTGGAFIPLGLATSDLGQIYQKLISPVSQFRRVAAFPPEPAERFSFFLLASLVLGVTASMPGRPRPRRSRGWVLGMIVLSAIGAGPRDDPAMWVSEGREHYLGGRFDKAFDAFRHAIKRAPGNPIPIYDAAAALYQIGSYSEARTFYLKARALADLSLKTRIDYALGNTSLGLGDVASALKHYDHCLASTANGPEIEEVRRDAALNKQFAEQQSRRSLAPPDDDDESARDQPDARKPGGDPPNSSTPHGQDAENRIPDGAASNQPPSGRRGPGGAGGSGPAPPTPGSPGDRLAKALENVREARRSRLDETPISDNADNRKDW